MFDGEAYSFRIDYAFNADASAVGNDIRLTAVPEPATWLLMGLGGLIVLGARPLRRALVLNAAARPRSLVLTPAGFAPWPRR